MATRYDEKLMDWFGIMDEKQFYAECDRSNAKFFRKLIAAWIRPGRSLQWEIGGASLCARIDGKKIKFCFLAPKCEQAGTKDHIKLTRATCVEHISKDRAEKRDQEVCAAAGRLAEPGTTRIDIVEPGTLPGTNQTALIKALVEVI